eukprot:Skav226468  [mRNA]  locus=scaffold1781:166697:172057:+ [translate_table: standard]
MLILISKKWTRQAIQENVIEAGRLVHVRLLNHRRNIDTLHCYQYANRRDDTRVKDRAGWFHKLTQVLRSLPNRNGLVLLGDFNCATDHCPGLIGTSEFAHDHGCSIGAQHADKDRFMQIIREFQLVGLNTWSTSQATYRHGDHHSRIDYIFTKLAHADAAAKHVLHPIDAPFIRSPSSTHIPLITSVPCSRPWTSVLPQAFNLPQRLKGRYAWTHWTPDWQSYVETSAKHIPAPGSHSTCDPPDPVSALHQTLHPIYHDHFGRNTQSIPHHNPFKLKWHLKHQAQSQHPSLHGCFQAWKFWKQFRQECVRQDQQAHARRDHQVQVLLNEAQGAADCHNLFQLYSIINKYSPKQQKQPIALKHQGHLLSPPEAHQHLVDFVQQHWTGDGDGWCCVAEAPGVPFSRDDLAHSLAQAPPSKATAPNCVPGVTIRHFADQLADWLYPQIQQWWSQCPPHLPASWRDATLIWISKPSKKPDTACNLRALALMEITGKQTLAVLIKGASQFAFPTLCRLPQFAFLPRRGTPEAIAKARDHCASVRHRFTHSHRDIQWRAAGLPPPRFHGGVQVSLDLSRAFDTVSREYLFCNLQSLGIPRAYCDLLKSWHVDTHYYVESHGFQTRIPVSRGVRQGCKGAPFLWCSLIGIVLQELATELTPRWLARCLTIFADDIHISAEIDTYQDLEIFLHKVGIIVAKLESIGLTISSCKSTAIVQIRGSHSHKLRRDFMHKTKDGWCIRVPVHSSFMLIPIKRSCKYLGIILSYGSFEHDTTDHRIRCAMISFNRLRRWLLARRLKLHTRYNIWLTTIFPVLTYGLWPIGLTTKCHVKLVQTMFWMFRKLIGNHQYVTRQSHLEVITQHNIPHPSTLLLRAVCNFQSRITARNSDLAADDIIRDLDWRHLASTIDILAHDGQVLPDATIDPDPDAGVTVTPMHVCILCSASFDSSANLRRHLTNIHGRTLYRQGAVHPGGKMVDGLPTCNHCHHQFPTWRSFHTHVARNVCLREAALTVPMPPQTPTIPATPGEPDLLQDDELAYLRSLPFGDTLLQQIASRAWHEIVLARDACEHLRSHCALCGQWLERTQNLLSHYRQHHPTRITHMLIKGPQLTHMVGGSAPCKLCEGNYKSTHLCLVGSQLGMLLTYGPHPSDSVDAQTNRLTCEICCLAFHTPAQVSQHVGREHKLATHDWMPSRDSLRQLPICRHCSREFGSIPGLRTHITLGYCDQFDPLASSEQGPLDAKWTEALQTGRLLQLLAEPETALQLTCSCIQCGESYQRAQDLVAHIQFAHPTLWHAGQSWTTFLMNQLAPIAGCVCCPQVTGALSQHVCVPWMQLGMMCQRMGLTVLVPFDFPRATLDMKLTLTSHWGPHAVLCDLLAQHDFAALWKHLDIQMDLSSRCIICGTGLHGAELHWHLMEAHGNLLHWCKPYLSMFSQEIALDYGGDSFCRGCGLHYQPPSEMDSDTLAQSTRLMHHLQFQCPIVLQLALIACVQHHGRLADDGQHRRPRGSGAHPLLPDDGTPVETPQTRQAESESKRPRGQAQNHKEEGHAAQGLQKVLLQMSKLCLQLDRDMQLLKAQDSFVLFMATTQEAILPQLVMRATKWREERVNKQTTMSLRQALSTLMFQELLNRTQALANAKPGERPLQLAQERQLLDSNGCWLYHRWNASSQTLVPDSRPAVKMATMVNWLTELVEMATDSHLITQFHALQSSDQPIVPWRMQISMRHTQAFQLLLQMCHCQVWQTIGVTLRLHHQLASPAANQLKMTLGKGGGKNKGKTKGTGKGPGPAPSQTKN